MKKKILALLSKKSLSLEEVKKKVGEDVGPIMEEMEKEPDTIWKNVDAGKEATITINSNFDPSWDIDDLGGSYTVILKEQHDGEMDRETKEI